MFGYKFIAEHTDVALRKILKIWTRKISGSKTDRVLRAFLYYEIYLIERKAPESIFSTCVIDGITLFKDFLLWVQETRRAACDLKSVPSNSQLMATFRPVEKGHRLECGANAQRRRQMLADGKQVHGGQEVGDDPRPLSGSGNAVGGSTQTQNFSISLFKRLTLILRGDERAKHAFFGMGQPLSRGQQDNGVRRDDYWDDVAIPFNDHAVRPRIDMRVSIGEVDPESSPRTYVSGVKQKQVWYDIWGPFTQTLNNFNKSGENNGTLNWFLDFLERKPNGDFYALSKRLFVMSIAMRIGKDIPGENVKIMVDLTTRTINSSGGLKRRVLDKRGSQAAWEAMGLQNIGRIQMRFARIRNYWPNPFRVWQLLSCTLMRQLRLRTPFHRWLRMHNEFHFFCSE